LEAILPRSEQARNETWNQGERVRVVIEDVSKDLRGQQIKVSRASAALLKRLFEMEVPEIYDYLDYPFWCGINLRKILIANLIRQFFTDGIGRYGHICTFPPQIFDNAFCVLFDFSC
jgi:hypothetical protein